MAGDSLKEDQIRLGLQEFEAIVRLLFNKDVPYQKLNEIMANAYADILDRKIKHSALL